MDTKEVSKMVNLEGMIVSFIPGIAVMTLKKIIFYY